MAATHFLIAFLISILFQWQKAEAEAAASMAMAMAMASGDDDHCQRKCGKIEIPYPFGVKKGCYLDQTFQVECNESSGSLSVPSLGWPEVDSISISTHTLRRKNDKVLALSFDKSGESLYGHSFYVNFWGTHYSISHTKNKFVASGCDFYAYLIDGDTQEFLDGCAPLCNRTDIVPLSSSSYSGLHCCEIDLPKDIRNATLWVDTMNTLSKSWAYNCGFFTFVDKDSLHQFNKINFSSCNESYSNIPVTIEWAVGNTSCKSARGREDYVCGQNTECIDYAPAGGYRCVCSNGYKGNPYLPNGCKDINECANQEYNNCPEKNPCVNTQGSYFCLPNRGHLLALFIPLGTGLAVGFLIFVAIGIWTWRKLKKIKERKKKQKFFKRNGGLLLQQQSSSCGGKVLFELIHFVIGELEKATDKFSESRVLGKGGLGTVYKGMLSDGRIVAVKKANIIDDRQVGQFINEVIILSQINHRHIVKLLGCCLETEVPLLVYEYISNGTLSHHLHDKPNNSTMFWENRLCIAAEVAGAIAYLHSCASIAIYHRDIKSNNILLDENFNAVISDFGLSRSVSIDKTHLTTLVGGTFGYLDPEYFQSGQLNDKSDVYAFGVVLAEILTGQKAVSCTKDDIGLAFRFRSAMKENCLFEIVEEAVASDGRKEEIIAVAKIAKRCLKINARKRQTMKEVAAELDQLRRTKELPEDDQDSFCDKYGLVSEKGSSYGIDSEVEDDQVMSEIN